MPSFYIVCGPEQCVRSGLGLGQSKNKCGPDLGQFCFFIFIAEIADLGQFCFFIFIADIKSMWSRFGPFLLYLVYSWLMYCSLYTFCFPSV